MFHNLLCFLMSMKSADTMSTSSESFASSRKDLIQALSYYAQPDCRKALIQVTNTFIPYISLWAVMIYMVVQGASVWITLLLSVIAAAFLVRLFILFHDCCHGAFFPWRTGNRLFGYVAGILTFTAFEDWQRSHVIHHANSGDLDNRGEGDVWTLTVAEYLAASRPKRFAYRVFRNPLILFSITPLILFLIVHRFPSPGAKKREHFSVMFTNVAIAALVLVMSLTLGFYNYLLIQFPIILIAASVGMWMFYVQHQYEDVYWARNDSWDLTRSGLEGSSYYKLPVVMQWIVGNIGLHHIHHVRANIPNYNLQRCYNEVPALQAVTPLTLRKSVQSLWLNLWDEEKQKLVSFNSIKKLPRRKRHPGYSTD
ncbi:fatty acid desaturase Des [Methyloglobulus morosus KoM1]|uniref:Fatty acid desaturase Des n=2 Tax=Methyloglobulus TaxID=1410680 RepID=V5C2G3_9GAMM|nr:fatty acid desaturase Des [Methyloglobulus morosus KoM1]